MFTPSTSWSERIPENEAALHEALAGRIRALQRQHATKAPLGRALHYHSHGGATAELQVLPDLPAWARVGIFAVPGRYDALVRFSSGGGEKLPDTKPDVRGFAVKVLGVPGKKLIPGLESATTQDFLSILSNTMPVVSAEKFVDLVSAASGSPLLALPRFIRLFGFFGFIPALKRLAAGLERPVPGGDDLAHARADPLGRRRHQVQVCACVFASAERSRAHRRARAPAPGPAQPPERRADRV